MRHAMCAARRRQEAITGKELCQQSPEREESSVRAQEARMSLQPARPSRGVVGQELPPGPGGLGSEFPATHRRGSPWPAVHIVT